jgi:hypothetical protein
VTLHEPLEGDCRFDGTTITVDCPGFREAVLESEAFLPPDLKLLCSGPTVDIYAGESKHFYYRGIRVYDLRYPAKLTYDFKHPYVQLTEDRTAGNSWSLIYAIGQLFQHSIDSEEILHSTLVSDDEASPPTFEASELSFDGEGEASRAFMGLLRSIHGRSPRLGKSLRIFQSSYEANLEKEPTTGVELPDRDWEELLGLLKAVSEGEELQDDDMHTAAKLFAAIQREIE